MTYIVSSGALNSIHSLA